MYIRINFKDSNDIHINVNHSQATIVVSYRFKWLQKT